MDVRARVLPWFALSLVPLVSHLCELHSPWPVPVVSGPSELHSPGCFRFGLATPQNPWELQVGGEETGAELQGNCPKCPRGSFSFWENPPANPGAPYKEGPVLSHSPPLQLDQGLSGSGPHTAQLSTLPCWCPWSPCVYHTSSLFPSLRPQATRSLSVLLKLCLAGEGAVNLAHSQETCGRPSRQLPSCPPTFGTFLSYTFKFVLQNFVNW